MRTRPYPHTENEEFPASWLLPRSFPPKISHPTFRLVYNAAPKTHLPLEHKYLIQSSYARFRELGKEVPDIDRQVPLLQWAHWGSAALLVSGLARDFVGKPWLPNSLGGILLLVFAFGWVGKLDVKRKQKRLREEQHEIWKTMDRMGVDFPLGNSAMFMLVASTARTGSPRWTIGRSLTPRPRGEPLRVLAPFGMGIKRPGARVLKGLIPAA